MSIHSDPPAGVVRTLCYNNNTNQTRVRLAGMIKVRKDQELQSAIFECSFHNTFCVQCLVAFLRSQHQTDLVAEAAGDVVEHGCADQVS